MDDNCCHCNLAALKTVTQLDEKDLVCVSFHNSIYEVCILISFLSNNSTRSNIVSHPFRFLTLLR